MSVKRLDKYIADNKAISRKEARDSVRKGKAAVDGIKITDPSFLVDTEKNTVLYDGQAIEYKEFIYIVMNKPSGVISASEDKTRETVLDLIPENLYRKGLFPVGRLDKDTTGLLIITDDGDFAHKVLSPKKDIYKTYIAELDGKADESTVAAFKNGVKLADGYVCKSAELKILEGNCVEIKISEGKYHQIKRMFGVFSLGVNSLKRTAVGGYGLPDDLAPGQSVEISKDELISSIKL